MKIHFLGGARTVTGSQHLIEVNGYKILLECGFFQGRRSDMYEINQNFAFDPKEVDFLILSHTHLDHSGNIPNLVKQGFTGEIYATEPTIELVKILLKDSAFLQELDVRWVNKLREKSNKQKVKPIYNQEDVQKCLHLFKGVNYDQTIHLGKGIKFTLRDAGHILGSAGVLLEINENGKQTRLGFSGDIGRYERVITHDPNPMQDLDALIIETTYGNRFHEPQEEIEQQLSELVNHAVEQGSKIIIPSFAIGRTQQLVYYLHKLFDQDRIHDIPIYVDSPMARKATDVYRSFTDYMDRETARIFLKGNRDPFSFHRLTYVDSKEESQALNHLVIPHVIISASGMCEGGRIMHHLRNNIEDPNAIILFVGFAAQHTLARKIMDGQQEVKIFGEDFRVKAQIKIMGTFSAHGDRKDLLNYVHASPPAKLKNIFLVHGELESAQSLVDAYRSKGYENVHIPEKGSVYEI